MSHAAEPWDGNQPANPTPTDPDRKPSKPAIVWVRLIAIGAGLAVLVSLMLTAFLSPAINSGPKDLPLAVSGPAPAAEQVTQNLEQQSPGTFDVTTYDSTDQAQDAVRNREEIGAISLGTDGVTITTASGAGTPYANLLTSIGSGLEAQGQNVTYDDVAPLTEDDPTGAAMGALALPLAFGGMISAVVFTLQFKRRAWARVAGVLAFTALAGMAITFLLTSVFHSVDANYWELAGIIALGIAAVSLTISGLEALVGYAGLGLGALLMLFIANPISGMATGAWWLPEPWGAIGQALPMGAAGTAIRSVAFFDGAGMGTAVGVLFAWATGGLILLVLGSWLSIRRETKTVAGAA